MFVTVTDRNGAVLAVPSGLVTSRRGEVTLGMTLTRESTVTISVGSDATGHVLVRIDDAGRCPEAVARFVRAYCAATP